MTQADKPTADPAPRQRSVVMQYGQTPGTALLSVEPDAKLLLDAAAKGAVWVRKRKPNGQMAKLARLRDLNTPILDGSELFANINPTVLASTVDEPTLIEAHKNYSFWFKPRGVLSQGSKWGDHTTITTLVAAKTDRVTHLVHRLDRAACGLMLVAHTRPAVRELTALFAKRQVKKRYRVRVSGSWTAATPLKLSTSLDERSTLTEIESASTGDVAGTSELLVQLHTGRKHQIRRHLADFGFPVVGDHRYGPANATAPLALMASELQFDCPFTKQAITCALPKSWFHTL